MTRLKAAWEEITPIAFLLMGQLVVILVVTIEFLFHADGQTEGLTSMVGTPLALIVGAGIDWARTTRE